MLGHGYRVALWHHSERQTWSSGESRRLLSPQIGKSPIVRSIGEHIWVSAFSLAAPP